MEVLTGTEKAASTDVQRKPVVTGSQAVIRCLLEEGVDVIFGYPGGAIMPIYDALYDFKDQVNHILVRHEQGAVHAAQGYARASGKVGVCFATSGPGATNLITGIADAQIDSTPLVCITGQVASSLLGTDAFQETDVIGITMPITKWNVQVTRAAEIPLAISKAFYIARSGRPGPVVIDITKDAQFDSLAFAYKKCTSIRSYLPVPPLNDEKIKEAALVIASSQRPIILAGHGVLISGAEERLQAFAERIDAPVACTLLGLSCFPTDHPLYVGYLGMHGNYAPNIKTNEADVVIAVGMRFDDRVTGNVEKYARQAKIIHIEIDASELDKIVKADVAIHADAASALEALITATPKRLHTTWLESFKPYYAVEFEKVIEKEIHPQSGMITMGEVIHLISEKTENKAITVTDVGQHQMVTSRYYQYKYPNTNITSGGLGTMGFGLPAGMGAKIGRPDKEVIAIIGDGGFQMTLQELGTIFQSAIPLKIVILNNMFLGMVRQWQQLFFEKRYAFTEMINPDFIAIAGGFHIEALKVEERKDLGSAIDQMLAAKGAFLLEVRVEKEENVFPMVPSGASISDIRLS